MHGIRTKGIFLIRCLSPDIMNFTNDSTGATDCGSETPIVTRGEQSTVIGHNQPLRIAQWNAEGVQRKKPELQAFLKMNSIYICCIQETHLNKNHIFQIRGNELYRQDREDRPKGGILTLVRNSIASVESHRSTSQITDTESITLNVILKDKHLTVCNIYSPPSKRSSYHNCPNTKNTGLP